MKCAGGKQQMLENKVPVNCRMLYFRQVTGTFSSCFLLLMKLTEGKCGSVL
jgi:hypothetical protein